jgi:hypothetical protein
MANWIPSERGAFVINPGLNSVRTKAGTEQPNPPFAGFQGDCASMFTTPLGPNHFVEATVAAIGPGPGFPNISTIAICARMSIDPVTGLLSYYAFGPRKDKGFILVFGVNVTPGEIFSASTDFQRADMSGSPRFDISVQPGDDIRLEAFENLLTAKVNDVVVVGPIDNLIPGAPFGVSRLLGGNVGVEGFPGRENPTSGFQLSNFRCGPLPSGEILTPPFDGIGSLVVPNTPTGQSFFLREASSDLSNTKQLSDLSTPMQVQLDYMLGAPFNTFTQIDSFISLPQRPGTTKWDAGTYIVSLKVLQASAFTGRVELWRSDALGSPLVRLGQIDQVIDNNDIAQFVFDVAEQQAADTDRLLVKLFASSVGPDTQRFSIAAGASAIFTPITRRTTAAAPNSRLQRGRFFGKLWRSSEPKPDEDGFITTDQITN